MTREDALKLLRDALSVSTDSPPEAQRIQQLLAATDPVEALRQFTQTEFLDWLGATFQQITGVGTKELFTAPIWLIPDPRFGARVTRSRGQLEIIVNQGALTSLCFRVCIWLLSKQVGLLMQSNRLNPQERNDVQKGFDDAYGLAIGLTIQSIRERTNLPDLRPALSPSDMDHLGGTLLAAEMFLLLHEISHIQLGHADGAALIEVPREDLWVAEEQTKHKLCELQADQHALDVLPERTRPYLARGAFFMLDLVVCHELWARRLSTAHPLALNRLEQIGRRPELKGDSVAEILFDPARLAYDRAVFERSMTFDAPPSERLKMIFKGRNAQYACDFIEWYATYIGSLKTRLPATR